MCDLMPDHHSYASVIDGIVGIHIKKRKLKNTGREENFIICWIVIGIYSFSRFRTYNLHQRKKELEHLVNLQGQEIQKQNRDLAIQNEVLKLRNDEMALQQKMITEQNIQLNEAKHSLQLINQSL